MLKLLGAISFITATSLIGIDLSRRLTMRSNELRTFIYSLQMIEAEMTYSFDSLRQIFYNIHKKTSGPIGIFYHTLTNKLSKPVGEFSSVWNDALRALKKNSALQEQDVAILQQFGENVGHHTIDQQQKQIKLTIYYLQKQLDEANEQKYKYDKTIKSIGFLLGILIVLILI
ncbi:MAG TPA: stage III sporulation protein SpoAB [Pseudogracilibacillus sp.]|nr:stage III sporulation protein SpoAB [Pseudogracilibacillus sp.]